MTAMRDKIQTFVRKVNTHAALHGARNGTDSTTENKSSNTFGNKSTLITQSTEMMHTADKKKENNRFEQFNN